MVAPPALNVVAPTPFFTEGGCSYRVLGQVQALVRAGVAVRLFSYPSGRDVPGLEVRRPRRSARQMGIGLNPIRVTYDQELLRLLMRETSPDVPLHVHLHEGAFLGTLLRHLKGTRFVADLEGSFVEEAGRTFPWLASGPIRPLAEWFERRIESSASEIVVSSVGLLQALRRRGHIPESRLHLVEDGVDTTQFRTRASYSPAERARWRAALGLSANDVIAVYVGGISPEQGIDALLERVPRMVKEVPTLRFVVYGVPTQLNRLERYQAWARRPELSGRVVLPGPLRFDLVPPALAHSDLAFTWKNSPLEGSGKVPLYMAAGLPTVAFRTPAHEAYLGPDGSRGGILGESYDALAEAVTSLARDAEERERLGASARATAEERLSWDIAAQKVLRLHGLTPVPP